MAARIDGRFELTEVGSGRSVTFTGPELERIANDVPNVAEVASQLQPGHTYTFNEYTSKTKLRLRRVD